MLSKKIKVNPKVQEALEKPKPGTGTYTIDMVIQLLVILGHQLVWSLT